MLIQLGALDKHSTRLNDPANVVAFGEKLASCMYGCIARARRPRSRQPTGFCKNNVPNHQLAPCAVPALLPHHPGWRK
jgi:hypothetical protein